MGVPSFGDISTSSSSSAGATNQHLDIYFEGQYIDPPPWLQKVPGSGRDVVGTVAGNLTNPLFLVTAAAVVGGLVLLAKSRK